MVLKRSKYGLNTGNSLVHGSTDRAKGIRNNWNGSTNGPLARIVKRIVIPTTTANDGSSTSADDEFKLMTMEQKRQLIEQIEQQLTEHVDGGMQAAIVTTHNGQQVSVPYREFLDPYQPSLPGNENDENQPPLRDLFQKSKKAPYGSAALEQPNLNRQSSTSHNCDINYSGNKKKRWELMDEVKQALHANNIDLDTFRGRIVAYTSVPTVNTTTGNNKPRVGVTTFSTNYVANVQRVGKHDVVIATDNKTDNDNVETAEIVADRKNQSKKSKRNAKQRKCSANVLAGSSSGSKSKKDFAATVPGVQLVYDFIEPVPVNNSFELGKRSYSRGKCYHGARSRPQKAKGAVALHMAEQLLVLSPASSTEQKPSMTESGVSQVAEKPANEAPIVEDNPIWGFISAALKKEARTTQTELNRAGWIVLDIIEQQQEETDNKRNNSTSSSNDDDDQDEEAEYDAFDDDNVSVSTDKSDSFEKPNVGVIDADKQPDEEEEDADGFVLFDVKQLQKQTNS